jgi:hypothetical protein
VGKIYISVHVVRILCVYLVGLVFVLLFSWVKIVIKIILKH